jgi:hypothetical protein
MFKAIEGQEVCRAVSQARCFSYGAARVGSPDYNKTEFAGAFMRGD